MDTLFGDVAGASGISPILMLIYIWSLPWKGVALWKASEKRHMKWFIALFITNTAGLLDALYIFYFSKKSKKQEKAIEG